MQGVWLRRFSLAAGIFTVTIAVALYALVLPPVGQPRDIVKETLILRAREQESLTFAVPGNQWLLVSLQEHGAHAVLRVRSGEGAMMTADTPLRRGGMEAVLLPPHQSTHLEVTLEVREPARFAGAAELRIRSFDSQAPELRAWTAWTQASAAYAQADMARLSQRSAAEGAVTSALERCAAAYQRAAAFFLSAGDRPMYASALLHGAWITYQDLFEWESASQQANQARSAFHALHDAYGEARAQSLHAAAVMEVITDARSAAPTEKSLGAPTFETVRGEFGSVASYHALGHQVNDQAQAVNNIGLSYYLESHYDQAIAVYEQAAELFRSTHDGVNEARSVQNAALVHYELADLKACRKEYNKALSLFDANDDLQLYGDILNNAALCEYSQGAFDTALEYYTRAEKIQRTLQNDRELARTLHGIGSTYFNMGDRDMALQLYTLALQLRTAKLDARGRAQTLRAIAGVESDLGRIDAALAHYRQALQIATSRFAKDRVRLELASTLTISGRIAEAQILVADMEARPQDMDGVVRGRLALERGRIEFARRNWDAAQAALAAAAAALDAFDAVADEGEALELLARAYQATGNHVAALATADRGLVLAEQVRKRTLNPELRASLFASWRRLFDTKIALLANAPSSASSDAASVAMKTLEVAERARAKSFADYLAGIDIPASKNSSAAAGMLESLYQELSNKRAQLALRVDKSGLDDPRSQHIAMDLARLRVRIDATRAGDFATSARELRLASLSSIQQHLPEDTAVISYWYGNEFVYGWVMTSASLTLHRLAPSQDVSQLLTRLRSSVAAVDSTLSEDLLRGLSVQLLQPLSEAEAKTRWIVVPDGPINFVPFGALPELKSRQPALARHVISLAPSSQLAVGHTDKESDGRFLRALVVGDPVYEFTDPRMIGSDTSSTQRSARTRGFSTTSLQRAPATAAEATRITELLRSGGKVDLMLGFDATRAELLKSDLGTYDLIHIATHTLIDADYPQLSAIALSAFDRAGSKLEPRLRLADLAGHRFKARLVVLSGCESALGRLTTGEGLVGFSYAFLAQGAKSVLGSLWKVPDQTTAAFMMQFYEELIVNRLDPAEAQANAARKLAQSWSWHNPLAWSAFTLYQMNP